MKKKNTEKGLNATESSPLQWAVSFKNSLLIGSSDWSKFETKVESRFGNKVYKYKISKYFLTNPLQICLHTPLIRHNVEISCQNACLILREFK